MMKVDLIALLIIGFLAFSSTAYCFTSGSTGADGAFNPTANTTRALPPNGVFNFTTVNIPSGVNVTFTKNAANTPVYILATGNVNIAGTISVNGQSASSSSATGGPGGFNGGISVVGQPGGNGLGPGGGGAGPSSAYYIGGGGGFGTPGGTANSNQGAGGPAYGNAILVPLIGGSGGGGGYNEWYGGGGGGGAILISSSTTINLTGSVTANGGNGNNGCGGGSGGAIRLVADTIAGNGSLSATGGSVGDNNAGGQGRIRVEANTRSFSFSSSPMYSMGLPNSPFLVNSYTLQITSIGNATVPTNPTASYSYPDVILPSGTTNPVPVTVTASNIPVGSMVTVSMLPKYGTSSNSSVTLSGTLASSTATTSININATQSNPSILMAWTTFAIQTAMYWDGEKIDKIRVASRLGGNSETTYLTESGKEIRAELIAGLVK